MSPEERFWSHVEKTDSCWIWTGAKAKGYGHLTLRNPRRSADAHRVSYEMAHGPIPPGMLVDHRCHNPACVRPDHLRLVTKKQNSENHLGATCKSMSGVRGVWWDKRRERWTGQVTHNGRRYSIRECRTLEEAEAAIVAMRNRFFTHNDIDRGAL